MEGPDQKDVDDASGESDESGDEGEEEVLGEAQDVREDECAVWSRSWPLGERMVKDGRSLRTASVTKPKRRGGDMGEHLGEEKEEFVGKDDLS